MSDYPSKCYASLEVSRSYASSATIVKNVVAQIAVLVLNSLYVFHCPGYVGLSVCVPPPPARAIQGKSHN